MLTRTLARSAPALLSAKPPTRIRTSPDPKDYTDRFSVKLHQRILTAAAVGHLSRPPTVPTSHSIDESRPSSSSSKGTTTKGKGREVTNDGTNNYVSSYFDQGFRPTKSRGINHARVELQVHRRGSQPGAGESVPSRVSSGVSRNDTRSGRGLTGASLGRREMSSSAFNMYQGQAGAISRARAPISKPWEGGEVLQPGYGKAKGKGKGKGKGKHWEEEEAALPKREVKMVTSSELEVGYWVETRV